MILYLSENFWGLAVNIAESLELIDCFAFVDHSIEVMICTCYYEE